MIEPSEEVKEVERRYEKALDDMEKHYKDVLEQIRAEIAQLNSDMNVDLYNKAINEVLQIIDNYMK